MPAGCGDLAGAAVLLSALAVTTTTRHLCINPALRTVDQIPRRTGAMLKAATGSVR
ncbi:MAG: hypothetical protein ACK4WH_15270 [Phycisphaerales bacterium]